MEPAPEAFGTWVRHIRVNRFRENQEEFGARVGVHPVTVSRWEQMFNPPFSREAHRFMNWARSLTGGNDGEGTDSQ